jgi:hypothetical protein
MSSITWTVWVQITIWKIFKIILLGERRGIMPGSNFVPEYRTGSQELEIKDL